MSVQQTKERFRKQIRRSYHDEIFAKKRKQLEQHFNQYVNVQNSIQSIIQQLSSSQLSLKNLIELRNISMTEVGILQLQKSNILNHIQIYLQYFYMNTDMQLQATWILCNLFYVKNQKLLSESLIQKIMNILQECSNKTIIENLLMLINNLLHDYKTFHLVLFQKYQIIQILWKQFNNQPNLPIIHQLLKIIIYLVKSSQSKNLQFKKFIKFTFALINTSNDNYTLILSTWCLQQLSKHLRQDTMQQIKNSNIVPKLVELAKVLKDILFSKRIILIISFNIKSFNNDQISKMIYPFFCQQIYLYPSLKKQIYRLLYDMLSLYIGFEGFAQSKLFQNAFTDLFSNIQKQIMGQLCYLFGFILMNFKKKFNTSQKQMILSRIKLFAQTENTDQDLNRFTAALLQSFNYDT